jgi:putative ABC transport system substrate-binding protein
MRSGLPFALACLAALVVAGSPRAEPAAKVYRLGVLAPTDRTSDLIRSVTLAALAQHGFAEGGNLVVEERIGAAEEMPELARQLVASRPDAILAIADWAVHPAREATRTIPIVMSPLGGDPVAAGLAASWAHPGGNVTGVVFLGAELAGKRVELLLEAVPAARRIASLWSIQSAAPINAGLRAAATRAGVDLVERTAGPETYSTILAGLAGEGVQALLIAPTPDFYRDAAVLAELAIAARLPTVCGFREFADRGCLIGYGPSLPELGRRTADFIARILRGAAPGDLPIERPTHFELAVNLRTARALGIGVPPAILARADAVIE